VIYFLIYLFLEVVVSTNIASSIGGVNTFLELIFSALAGIVLLINFRKTLVENMHSVSQNQIDFKRFQELNLFSILGAFLLIAPGFLTDIIGILMQFSVFVSMLVNRFSAKYSTDSTKTNYYHKEKIDVIDVEIINDDSTARLNTDERNQRRS
jgi:2-isopropylmalate synthase/UPF0716 protein FxsA